MRTAVEVFDLDILQGPFPLSASKVDYNLEI